MVKYLEAVILWSFYNLNIFFESAKNESFSKTAEKYMVPTSSVSASVKRLEKELGCELFDRHSNKIILNSNGKRMQMSLHNIFDELNQAITYLSADKTDTREIKMLVRAMRDDITDYIIDFRKSYPRIAFKITLDFGEKDFEKYDIIIDEKNNTHSDYENFELRKMKLTLVANPKSPLCNKKLTMKQLKDFSFISWGEGSNMHKILLSTCARSGFTPDIAVMTNDIKCHEKLIESGLGIGLAREKDYTGSNLSPLDITDFNESYTVCSYYKNSAAFGNVKLFLNFLKTKAY